MTGHNDTTATLPWMHEGTALLLRVVDKLDDDVFRAPSRLPGWTRAHLLAHVARNAEALTRLATWARTGVETPMYADRAQRTAQIEESAKKPASTLRSELTSTADTLVGALDTLTAAQWQAPVRSALGRAIPATEIPWMRTREVWLHTIDLGISVELPSGVTDLLLDEVTTDLSRKDGCPDIALVPSDRNTTWVLGREPAERTIEATASELAQWLTGRMRRGDWPELPNWL